MRKSIKEGERTRRREEENTSVRRNKRDKEGGTQQAEQKKQGKGVKDARKAIIHKRHTIVGNTEGKAESRRAEVNGESTNADGR